MKRRRFLKTIGTAAMTPVFWNGTALAALSKPLLFSSMNDETDRVLVLVQLNGGNDGLNTFIPLDQYGNLYNARSNIIIPETSIIPVTDTIGFHPALPGIKDLYDEGRLGIVQNVGYPDQNRSHFRSMEIWSSGSSSEERRLTGWLGRYLDEQFPGFPDAYPNGENPDPFAIAMGDYISETCQGSAANFSVTLNDPFSLGQLYEWEGNDDAGSIYGEELAFVRLTISQTNAYADRIAIAAENGNNRADYPDTQLAGQMKNVARLISGGMRTPIYIVSLGGFDTHGGQVESDSPTTGRHAELLATLSEAVHAFQNDLKLLGLEDRVLGMTFSEFGRQIRSNGSLGTDHGTAAPLMLFGPRANTQILGDNPEIPQEVNVQEGVPMQYDFRDVYGSVLIDWFGLSQQNVKSLLHEGFLYLPVANS